MRKLSPLILSIFFLVSCRTVNIAWRGTVYATENVATTDGKVEHRPGGSFTSRVDAPKTTSDSLKAGEAK